MSTEENVSVSSFTPSTHTQRSITNDIERLRRSIENGKRLLKEFSADEFVSAECHEEARRRVRLCALLDEGLEEEFVQQLSKAGSEWTGGGGGTFLLRRAVCKGLARAVAALLDARVDPNATTDADPEPPLVAAARLGHDDVLEVLLRSGNGRLKVDAADAEGDTALHHVSRGRRARAAALLLRAGADAGLRNRLGLPAAAPADTRALLDRCVTGKYSQVAGFEVEMDFSILAPSLEEINDCSADFGGGPSSRNLRSEMDVLHQLFFTSTRCDAVNHPLVSAFLEIKQRKMGTLVYTRTALHVLYIFLLVIFAVFGEQFLVDDVNRVPSYARSCYSQIKKLTVWENIFHIPRCPKNGTYDPQWFNVFAALLFLYGCALCMYLLNRRIKGEAFHFICMVYSILCIAFRIIGKWFTFDTQAVSYISITVVCLMLMKVLSEIPLFACSVHLISLTREKIWKFLYPLCCSVLLFVVSLVMLSITIRVINLVQNRKSLENLYFMQKAITRLYFITIEAIEIKNRALIMEIIVFSAILIGLMLSNSLMNLTSYNKEKKEATYVHRILHSRIMFIMESERLLISLHNCMIRVPCIPWRLIRKLNCAVIFPPGVSQRTCSMEASTLTKIQMVKLSNNQRYSLPNEVWDETTQILEQRYYHERTLNKRETISEESLENRLSEFEIKLQDRIYELQGDLRNVLHKQNSMIENRINDLGNRMKSDLQPTTKHVSSGDSREQQSGWLHHIRAQNSVLEKRICNSHFKLEAGFGRLEKCLAEMMIHLDRTFGNSKPLNELDDLT